MELLFVCLAAHDSEFRRWPDGVDRRICQTFAASPAEPGELLLGFRPDLIIALRCRRESQATLVPDERILAALPAEITSGYIGNGTIVGDFDSEDLQLV